MSVDESFSGDNAAAGTTLRDKISDFFGQPLVMQAIGMVRSKTIRC